MLGWQVAAEVSTARRIYLHLQAMDGWADGTGAEERKEEG